MSHPKPQLRTREGGVSAPKRPVRDGWEAESAEGVLGPRGPRAAHRGGGAEEVRRHPSRGKQAVRTSVSRQWRAHGPTPLLFTPFWGVESRFLAGLYTYGMPGTRSAAVYLSTLSLVLTQDASLPLNTGFGVDPKTKRNTTRHSHARGYCLIIQPSPCR